GGGGGVGVARAFWGVGGGETRGATLLFPANLYNFGSPLPPVIGENTPMRPSSRKGQLRVAIEDRIAEAAERGVRAIAVRAGDFYGRGHGTWIDLVLTKELGRGRVTYPGPLDVTHEWAYLPDFAAALLRIANRRETLPQFASFGFPGHAVTGREFTAAIARAVRDKLEVKPMTWWLFIRCARSCRSVESCPRSLTSGTNRTASMVAGFRRRSARSRAPRLTSPSRAP